jgi:protein-tyrosine phosphatase
VGLLGWLRRKFGTEEKVFETIPLKGIAGRLHVSPMPFGPYDTKSQLLKRYRAEHVGCAIPLVTDAELARKSRKDLLSEYARAGIEVIRFPIADLTSPELEAIVTLVADVVPRIQAGTHVAVHCNAGVGRTGVVVSCLVCALLDLDDTQAIAHVRGYMHTQMTESQKQVVQKFHATRVVTS